MGQQQLLLLVLSVALVGIAVIAGVQSFSENQQKSELDRYTDTGVAMTGDIIAFYMKPTTQGGAGQEAAPLGDLAMSDLGYREDVSDTWHGFARSGIIENRVVRYIAADATHPFVHLHKWPLSTGDTLLEVHVFGPSQDCIVVRSSQYQVTDWSDGKTGGAAPDTPSGCSW